MLVRAPIVRTACLQRAVCCASVALQVRCKVCDLCYIDCLRLRCADRWAPRVQSPAGFTSAAAAGSLPTAASEDTRMAPSAPTPGLPQGAECRLASGSGMLTSGSSGGLAGGGGLARGGGAGMAPYPAAGAPGWQPAGAAAAPGAHQAPALSAGPYGAPPGFFPQYGACPVLHPSPLLMIGASRQCSWCATVWR